MNKAQKKTQGKAQATKAVPTEIANKIRHLSAAE